MKPVKKLFFQACEENRIPIRDALSLNLADATCLLEIGSGIGLAWESGFTLVRDSVFSPKTAYLADDHLAGEHQLGAAQPAATLVIRSFG